MQVLVTVRDSATAGDLIRRLLEEFDAGGVSYDADSGQVRIEPDRSPDRALVRALDVVEAWVTASDGGPTRVEVDGRAYTIGPAAALGGVR
jgi:hypothetical protein